MYRMRYVYHGQRGKAPEGVECLQTLNAPATRRMG